MFNFYFSIAKKSENICVLTREGMHNGHIFWAIKTCKVPNGKEYGMERQQKQRLNYRIENGCLFR